MLTHLHIEQFVIVDKLHIDFQQGTTALTGETGAGKSILIEALGLALGDRAEASSVRAGAKKATVAVHFDISKLTSVQQWLAQQDLEEDQDCVLSRIINKEGRSRGYINGYPVPLQRLRELGDQLIEIHGQHAHHSLLNPANHQQILDQFGDHQVLSQTVANHYKRAKLLQDQLAALRDNEQQRQQRLNYLEYVVKELDELALVPHEWESLGEEQKRLSHSELLIRQCQQSLEVLQDSDSSNVLSILHQQMTELNKLSAVSPPLSNAHDLLQQAQLLVEEACHEIHSTVDSISADPDRQHWVDQRLSSLLDLSRKHRVDPEGLLTLQQSLAQEWQELLNHEQETSNLEQQLDSHRQLFFQEAKKLSQKRKQAAKPLAQAVTTQMHALGMPHGSFQVALNPLPADQLHRVGQERVCFKVQLNPGSEWQPLHQSASGGELSRISLSLEIAHSEIALKPVLIFDEVDVGIGGATAAMVGHCLKRLGQKAQVLCVTHHPQVASQATQHLHLSKTTTAGQTRSAVTELSTAERVEEIARMLGGLEVTEQTRAHAQEMLQQ